MKNRKFSNLNFRIVAINLFAGIFLISIFYIFTIKILYPTFLDEKKNHVKEISKLYSEDIKLLLSFDDFDGVKSLLQKIISTSKILKIDIFTKEKKQILSSHNLDLYPKSTQFIDEVFFEEKNKRTYFLYTKKIDDFFIVTYYDGEDFINKISYYKKFTILIATVFLLITIITLLITKKYFNFFTLLSNKLSNIDTENLDQLKIIYDKTDDEREVIAKSINSFVVKIKDEMEKNSQKERIMFQQARLAQMGEMIGNIAHQWRQPLNELSLLIQSFEINSYKNTLTKDKIEKMVENGYLICLNMSKTIDDFRDFFNPKKEIEEFILEDAIKESLSLITSSFAHNNILILKEFEKDIVLKGYKNEFQHVLLNLLSNSKGVMQYSAFKILKIKTYTKNGYIFIEIIDSGGGIKDDIMDKIFEPYFTTKDQGEGSGIGLFMSMAIIKSMGGNISAKNVDFFYNKKSYFGANFIIELQSKKEVNL